MCFVFQLVFATIDRSLFSCLVGKAFVLVSAILSLREITFNSTVVVAAWKDLIPTLKAIFLSELLL